MKGATGESAYSIDVLRVSIRAPREGGDLTETRWTWAYFVSIRAPREGGDGLRPRHLPLHRVSIRAPREGGDVCAYYIAAARVAFQSAPPVKGATIRYGGCCKFRAVSIRAPREGGDGGWGERSQGHGRFNPRPP